MYESIISPHGLTRIFDGELVPQLTREGRTHHYRMLGFRFVSDEVKQREGYGLKIDAGSCPDNRGAYVATWMLANGRKMRQTFFPREWSRDDVLTAIRETYETREPVKWMESGKFFQGRTRGGFRIVLELDEQERVVDAIPRKSNTTFEHLVRWRVEHGYSKHSRYFCDVCGKLRRGHPLGHSTPLKSFYRRVVRRRARKLFWSLIRRVKGIAQ
jgi:hypothetical protein